MKKYASALLCLTLGLNVQTVQAKEAPNLLVNGNFETGNLDGWIQGGDTAEQRVGHDFSGTPLAHTGLVFSDGAWGAGYGLLSQDVATLAGARYRLEFDLQRNDSAVPPETVTNGVRVSFGGTQLLAETNVGADWTHFSFLNIVAGGPISSLVFGNYNKYDTTQLDNVYLQITHMPAVPEPGSATLMLAGLGLLGWLRSRRGAAGQL